MKTTLKKDRPDERPPWRKTTMMKDHPNERPHWWETTPLLSTYCEPFPATCPCELHEALATREEFHCTWIHTEGAIVIAVIPPLGYNQFYTHTHIHTQKQNKNGDFLPLKLFS